MDAASLFPGRLAAHYEAFVTAVAAEGEATEEVKKTQVSFATHRKFAWLIPLTQTKTLLLLDMYQPQQSPLFRDVIAYRHDKHTHQIEVNDPETITLASKNGWFGLAYQWGAKELDGQN